VRLPVEGIEVIEYAQCGLEPLLKLAGLLGIEWHVLADGDRSGEDYARAARRWDRDGRRVSLLDERDLEACLWRHGYDRVLARLAGRPERRPGEADGAFARRTIQRAVERHSKPQVALRVMEELSAARSPGVPPPLRRTLEATLALARERPLLAATRRDA